VKYKEAYAGYKRECFGSLKEIFTKLLKGELTVEDEVVKIPEDKELDYKIKYDDDEMEGQLAIKISWDYVEEEEEDEEEEEFIIE